MRITAYRELPPGWEGSDVLLMHHAFGSSWDPRTMTHPQFSRRYPSNADYVGLCAVEARRILSSVEVVRFPFRTRQGEFTCSGLGAVATLPSFSRRGLARKLIVGALRRETRAGSPFMFLYTGRSMVAHALYEGLGFRDVLEFPRAARLVPEVRPELPRGWRWRTALRSDRAAVRRLHEELAKDRCGFTRHGVNWWSGSGHWWVLEQEGTIEGYANLRTEGRVLACHEGMARASGARTLLLRALESTASGKWLLLGGPLLHELRTAPQVRSYAVEPGSYRVLMARPLIDFDRSTDLAHELGADRPDFLNGIADSF